MLGRTARDLAPGSQPLRARLRHRPHDSPQGERAALFDQAGDVARQFAATGVAAAAVGASGLMKAACLLFRLQDVRALLGGEFSAAGGPGLGSGGVRLRLRGQAPLSWSRVLAPPATLVQPSVQMYYVLSGEGSAWVGFCYSTSQCPTSPRCDFPAGGIRQICLRGQGQALKRSRSPLAASRLKSLLTRLPNRGNPKTSLPRQARSTEGPCEGRYL